MKTHMAYRFFLVIALFLLLPAFQPAVAASMQISPLASQLESQIITLQDDEGDQLVLGGSFTLEDGEHIAGRLVVLGGRAEVKQGAFVNGDAVIMGGSLVSHGAIDGDVLVLGGLAEFGPTAVVRGDISSVSGNLEIDPNAKVDGEIHENLEFPLSLPGSVDMPNTTQAGEGNIGFSFWGGVFFMFRSFVWAALAILIVLFFPRNAHRVGEAIVSNPVISGGLGLITGLVGLVIMLVLALTIIGIPLSILLAIALVAAWAFGMVVIGVETGERFAHLVKQEWTLPVCAGVGTFLITLVIYGVGELIPCIGWLLPVIVGSIGLGGTFLTMFGVRDYPVNPGESISSHP